MNRTYNKQALDRLQQERWRRAYMARLVYNDAQERGAERCDDCGDDDPWLPRCEAHRPL